MQNIEVKLTSKKGRGVYALKEIKMGEIIEICPTIIFSEKEAEELEKTILSNYWFSWKDWETNEYGCIAGGYALFYNHSNTPNAKHERDYTTKTLIFTAQRDIHTNEEITIKYGTLWFNPIEE